MFYGNPTIDERYILQSCLGHGGTSKVFLASSVEGEVALKVVRKDKNFSRKDEQTLVLNECQMSEKIGYHPNIINVLGYNLDGRENLLYKVYEISYSVNEYCPNGSLYDYVKQNGPLEEPVA
jgi:serine/threonine protein kinase